MWSSLYELPHGTPLDAILAQILVEQEPEKLCVGGAIPSDGTIYLLDI